MEGVGGEKHKEVKEAAMTSEKKGNEGFFSTFGRFCTKKPTAANANAAANKSESSQ